MKYCGICKAEKPKSEFHKRSKAKDGLQSQCKNCNTVWVRARYMANKKYYDDRNKLNIQRNITFVKEYLLSHPCVDCGEKDIIVLDFDHIKDKKIKAISSMCYATYGLETIVKEIAKCEVRCANCHRRITYLRKQSLVV
jgi:hypothetical protein